MAPEACWAKCLVGVFKKIQLYQNNIPKQKINLMSALQDKYAQVITMARQVGINDLQVREEGNMLHVTGTAPSEEAKQRVWDVYNTLNPGYKSADMALDINTGAQEYEVKSGDSLSKIGQQFGVAWKDIYEANKDVIKNPDVIQPGWKLKIPKK